MILGGQCFIVAEVGQAHDGSLGTAHAFVDAVARTGADAIKFQTHIADAESTREEPWRTRFSRQDATRFDYWKRMEFSGAQWSELRNHAEDRDLGFLSSPFSPEAVDLLERVGVVAWKVASGEVSNSLLLDRMLETDLPVLISTGMCTLEELDAAVARVREGGNAVAVLQCTSLYPTPPERTGLNMFSFFRERYGCPVGLSDHSGTVFPAVAAAALGTEVLEVHVTLSREMFGPDVTSSITIDELRSLVEGVRFVERAMSNPVDKNAMAAEMETMRRVFGRSLVASSDLPVGTVLLEEHVALKKPGTGVPLARLSELVGGRLRRGLYRGELLRDDDVEVLS